MYYPLYYHIREREAESREAETMESMALSLKNENKLNISCENVYKSPDKRPNQVKSVKTPAWLDGSLTAVHVLVMMHKQ